jgi:acyl dehydratase
MPVMSALRCHHIPLARPSWLRQAVDKSFILGLSSTGQSGNEAPMKYFEDMEVGAETIFGDYDVTREEVLEFALKYDPQPFHLSDDAAAKTHFGRLAASGWHTCAMTMAVIVRHLSEDRQAGLGSPGVDELRWLKPVYPGDRLTVSGKILEKTPSRSKPEIGSIRTETIVTNQDGVRVMRFISIVLMLRRPSEA